MKELEDTFKIEIQRLHNAAMEGPLSLEDTNKLVKLTAALKNYLGNPLQEDEAGLSGLSMDEILELANMKVDE